MKVLVDGDVMVYRIGFGLQKTHYVVDVDGYEVDFQRKADALASFPDIEPTLVQTASALNIARSRTHLVMNSLISKFDSYQIYLSGSDNFRYDIAKTRPYKGTRSGEKPVHYDLIRGMLIKDFNAKVIDGMEADDALGIDQVVGETCIASMDKDLWMIPGHHFNVKTGDTFEVSDPGILGKGTGTGFKWFCAQCFLGDTIDNIPGLHQVGPVITKRLLGGCETVQDLWSRVVTEYAQRCVADRLHEVATLLWIRRRDYETYEEYLGGNIDGYICKE